MMRRLAAPASVGFGLDLGIVLMDAQKHQKALTDPAVNRPGDLHRGGFDSGYDSAHGSSGKVKSEG